VGPSLLDVRGLSVALRRGAAELPVVQDVRFILEAGGALGIVGESGSGKSLTALALLQLLPDSAAVSGSIHWRGEELLGAPAERLRRLRGRELALVLQDPSAALSPVLTVGAQLVDAIRAHRKVSRPKARAAAVELLRRVGVPDPARRVDAYPHELSGGLRQRVVLAAALAGDPSLLVADEPTTALDATVQAQVLALLAGERRRGMALILVSHDLGAIGRTCDAVAVMYAGRIVEQGPTAQLFDAPAHPYTAALLRVEEALQGQTARGALPVIPGGVPSVTRFSERGCLFRERCGFAAARCAEVTPGWTASGERGVACHFPLARAA
jgi:peptide/nickel transport system ATP-binding protein